MVKAAKWLLVRQGIDEMRVRTGPSGHRRAYVHRCSGWRCLVASHPLSMGFRLGLPANRTAWKAVLPRMIG